MQIVGICSGGGHQTELLSVLAFVPECCIVITETEAARRNKIEGVTFLPIVDPHRSFWAFVLNIFQAFKLVLVTRPDVVISTGAGMTVPYFIICRLFGANCIWIESGARIRDASYSGKFCYRFSHLFIVQSPELTKLFPKAILKSILPLRGAIL